MTRGLLVLVAAGLALASAPATAQVTFNEGALDALPKQAPRPAHRPAPHRPPAANAHAKPRQTARPEQPEAPATPAPAPSAPKPVPSAAPATPPKPPTIPVTPPAILALPPPVPVPLAHPPPPPVVPLTADAPGAALPIPGGIRVTFGRDRADLNPATQLALQRFAHELADGATPINIYAYAAGSPDDPSAPRRLSLERALAARAVLMQAGIPSARIYPRALGPAASGADGDRIDVVAGTPAAPAPQRPAG